MLIARSINQLIFKSVFSIRIFTVLSWPWCNWLNFRFRQIIQRHNLSRILHLIKLIWGIKRLIEKQGLQISLLRIDWDNCVIWGPLFFHGICFRIQTHFFQALISFDDPRCIDMLGPFRLFFMKVYSTLSIFWFICQVLSFDAFSFFKISMLGYWTFHIWFRNICFWITF